MKVLILPEILESPSLILRAVKESAIPVESENRKEISADFTNTNFIIHPQADITLQDITQFFKPDTIFGNGVSTFGMRVKRDGQDEVRRITIICFDDLQNVEGKQNAILNAVRDIPQKVRDMVQADLKALPPSQ